MAIMARSTRLCPVRPMMLLSLPSFLLFLSVIGVLMMPMMLMMMLLLLMMMIMMMPQAAVKET